VEADVRVLPFIDHQCSFAMVAGKTECHVAVPRFLGGSMKHPVEIQTFGNPSSELYALGGLVFAIAHCQTGLANSG